MEIFGKFGNFLEKMEIFGNFGYFLEKMENFGKKFILLIK